MTEYNIVFREQDGSLVNALTVEARNPEHAIEKGLGLKGDYFTTRNEIVASAIERGERIFADVTPKSRDYQYSSGTLKKGLEKGEIKKDYPGSDLEKGDKTGLTTRKG